MQNAENLLPKAARNRCKRRTVRLFLQAQADLELVSDPSEVRLRQAKYLNWMRVLLGGSP